MGSIFDLNSGPIDDADSLPFWDASESAQRRTTLGELTARLTEKIGAAVESPADGLTASQVAAVAVVTPTLGATASAPANVTAIQAALDVGGLVRISGSGIVYIDNTLTIGSFTKLVLDPQITIKLTGSSVKNLLTTKAYARTVAGYTPVTLTWTAGRQVKVTLNNHGLVKGQYWFMWSSTLAPSNFAGTFPITSVQDANNFFIQLHRTPSTAPAGTAQGVLADQWVSVEGGTWDSDFPNISSAGLLNQTQIVMGAAAHVRMGPRAQRNCAKYLTLHAGVYDFEDNGQAIEGSSNDGIKVYGPAVMGKISGISGYTSGDDVVSIQGKEAAAFIGYAPYWGDAQNITIERIGANTTVAGAVTVYYSANEYTGGILLREIGGGAGNWGIGIASGYANSVFDDITIDGTNAAGAPSIVVSNSFTGCVGNKLDVRGIKYEPDTYASNRQGFITAANLTIKLIQFRDIDIDSSVWPTASTIWGAINGPVNQINIIGGNLNGVGTNPSFLQLSAAVDVVNVNGVNAGAGWSRIVNAISGTPTINITGCDLACLVGVTTSVPCTINANGNRLNMSLGLARTDAAVAVKLKGNGNNLAGGALFTNGSATGLWEFYGLDFPVDIGATGVQKTISGQHCFNTGAARGTVAQNRLVTCNGTNWVQVDTPANVF